MDPSSIKEWQGTKRIFKSVSTMTLILLGFSIGDWFQCSIFSFLISFHKMPSITFREGADLGWICILLTCSNFSIQADSFISSGWEISNTLAVPRCLKHSVVRRWAILTVIEIELHLFLKLCVISFRIWVNIYWRYFLVEEKLNSKLSSKTNKLSNTCLVFYKEFKVCILLRSKITLMIIILITIISLYKI